MNRRGERLIQYNIIFLVFNLRPLYIRSPEMYYEAATQTVEPK